ncbi:hypothetical protein Aduo_007933 [Ancylostoma duodenale]
MPGMVGGVQEPPENLLNASMDHVVDVFNGGANLTGFFSNRTETLPHVLNSTLSANGTTALNYVVERILSRANVSVSPDVKQIVARDQREAYKKHVVANLYNLSKKKGVLMNEIANTYNFNDEDKDKNLEDHNRFAALSRSLSKTVSMSPEDKASMRPEITTETTATSRLPLGYFGVFA